jgi:hypothetical protein
MLWQIELGREAAQLAGQSVGEIKANIVAPVLCVDSSRLICRRIDMNHSHETLPIRGPARRPRLDDYTSLRQCQSASFADIETIVLLGTISALILSIVACFIHLLWTLPVGA